MVRKSHLSSPRVKKRNRLAFKRTYYGFGVLCSCLVLAFLVNFHLNQETSGKAIPLAYQAPSWLINEKGSSKAILRQPLTPDLSLFSEFQTANLMNLVERMDYWSQLLVDRPDVRLKVRDLARLTKVQDTLPVVPKKLDQTVFLETVMALSRSRSADQVVKNILEIRYQDGKFDFVHRNHLSEFDWFPHQLKTNQVREVTAELAQALRVPLQVEMKQVDRFKWLESEMSRHDVATRHIASIETAPWQNFEEIKVSYIPIEHFQKVFPALPEGAILNIVRKHDPGHLSVSSDQGFILKKDRQILIRYASQDGEIRSSELKTFVRDRERAHSQTPWPVIGMSVYLMNDSSSPTSFLSESM